LQQGGIDPDLLGHGGASGIRAAFIEATAILMVAISFPGNFLVVVRVKFHFAGARGGR
jgi:hypothetical protein